MTNTTHHDSPPANTPFERIRQVDPDGIEFWSARDLMQVLEYTNWRNFKGVLLKSQISCENSGYDPSDHFAGAIKMVSLGSDAKREVEDMHLSREEKSAYPRSHGDNRTRRQPIPQHPSRR